MPYFVYKLYLAPKSADRQALLCRLLGPNTPSIAVWLPAVSAIIRVRASEALKKSNLNEIALLIVYIECVYVVRRCEMLVAQAKREPNMSEISSDVTPARRLFQSTLARLGATIPLSEIHGDNGRAWFELISHAPFHQGNCGNVRIYEGPGIFRIVTCSIAAPAIGLDSHMLFAFTPSEGAIPHFTVDSVQSGDHMAFHLDLIPKLDLATNLPYMDWAFAGVNDSFTAASAIEGLSPAHISPRQRAVMSPWMVVNRATREAFDAVEPLVHAYLDHWLALLASPPSGDVLAGATASQLAARDKANKAIIFDPNVDKVWNQIRGLIGTDAVEAIRRQLMQTSA